MTFVVAIGHPETVFEEMTGATLPVAGASSESRPAELGPYRLHERLGAGGLACVYRARRVGDPDACDVALKRLHPHLGGDAVAVASFIKEARIAHLLDHPVIRRVFSLRRERDELFMTMEYVDGGSLHGVLKRASVERRRFPLRGVLAVLHRICGALHYAHELVDESGAPAGFVHRDVSQSNLILSTSGQLKVIDMGVARLRTGELATNSGLIKGKLGYMALEVMANEPFDRRADVFSIGVVAWELLTQRKLFRVCDPPDDIDRIRARPVEPPSRRNPSCPPELDAIVLRALATGPADRWETCSAMAKALQDVATQLDEPLSDGAPIELGDVFEDPTVDCPPPRSVLRPRLARGTTAASVVSPATPAVSAPAVVNRRRTRCRRSFAIGAVVGSLVAIIGCAVLAAVARPSIEAAPVAAPAWAGPLSVGEPDVTRLDGPWPRSRSSSSRYRARVCIDVGGAVTSVAVLEGPERLEARITRALLRWRYLPYARGGVVWPVCFHVESRVQKMD
jgi:serine/threonine protein kinase